MSAVYGVWGFLRLGSRAIKCELQPSVLAAHARLCTECEVLTKPQCCPEKRGSAEEFLSIELAVDASPCRRQALD